MSLAALVLFVDLFNKYHERTALDMRCDLLCRIYQYRQHFRLEPAN